MYVTEPKWQVSEKKQMISYDCKSDWCTYRIKIHCKLQNLQRVQSQHSKIMPWWTCVRLELKRSLAFICNLHYKHFTIAWISKIVMIRKRSKLITSTGTDQLSKHFSLQVYQDLSAGLCTQNKVNLWYYTGCNSTSLWKPPRRTIFH